MRHFKAGLILEEEIGRALNAVGIAHRRTLHLGREDVEDRVDLIVPTQDVRRALEFQITLRAKQRTKMSAFALRALITRVRGVRVYLEVVATRRKDDLARVALNVARAIHTIVRRFRDFGAHRLLGLRVNARTAAIEKFDILKMCGAHLLENAERFWARVEELRRASDERSRRNRETFMHLARLVAHRANQVPRSERTDVRMANARAFFMPRRHC